MPSNLEIPKYLIESYADVWTPEAAAAVEALAPLNSARLDVMARRIARRNERSKARHRIDFLDPESTIPRTEIRVRDAREGNFEGAEIPHDLQRQWIQGTGPATKPRSTTESGIRNVAYALLSGADGWMFDGEDALG
ncbi:MAG TPA: malate synthase, partial [Thermoanaerobaculia bacterium]